ncbi:MAG TPA: hypothetical protein VNI20_06490 [Fimbriimonadaceae bacterium]|nr:hypothetical protein [Fimbriimonadaceae bacterium]
MSGAPKNVSADSSIPILSMTAVLSSCRMGVLWLHVTRTGIPVARSRRINAMTAISSSG